jgi:hypothetical protein
MYAFGTKTIVCVYVCLMYVEAIRFLSHFLSLVRILLRFNIIDIEGIVNGARSSVMSK